MKENFKDKERKDRKDAPKKEFEEMLLEVRRVTRVTTGGRKMSFRAIILVGNKKGKIGLGISKGPDVAIAVRKATHEAYKSISVVPITNSDSVPYATEIKYKSAIVKLIPAAPGTGMKAGSSVRSVLELAGYTNMLSKIVGTNNKLNNALATIMALSRYKVDRNKMKKIEESKDPISADSELANKFAAEQEVGEAPKKKFEPIKKDGNTFVKKDDHKKPFVKKDEPRKPFVHNDKPTSRFIQKPEESLKSNIEIKKADDKVVETVKESVLDKKEVTKEPKAKVAKEKPAKATKEKVAKEPKVAKEKPAKATKEKVAKEPKVAKEKPAKKTK